MFLSSRLASLPSLAPVVLRFGLVAVFAWFGASQLTDASMWVSLVPEWANRISGISATTLVMLNGGFEVIATILLAIGIQVRIVATFLALHLFVITSHLGLSPVGVRDFGLSFATLAMGFFGQDVACIRFESRGPWVEETRS